MREWDPKTVVVMFGENRVEGYADGTFVRGERNADAFSTKVGSDGGGARVRNRNRSGTLTITLLQSSASNKVLSQIAEADELDNTGVGVKRLLVKTIVGESLFFAKEAWIRKRPAQEYATDLSNREWVFESLAVEMHEGGL
jgi:hypothetical protein